LRRRETTLTSDDVQNAVENSAGYPSFVELLLHSDRRIGQHLQFAR
jgi:hypothetical protein